MRPVNDLTKLERTNAPDLVCEVFVSERRRERTNTPHAHVKSDL